MDETTKTDPAKGQGDVPPIVGYILCLLLLAISIYSLLTQPDPLDSIDSYPQTTNYGIYSNR
jgi:hypothetical protein